MFEHFADAFIRPEVAHLIDVAVVRSTSYEVARARCSELHTVIIDLSLMPVMELLTRITMSSMSVAHLQGPLSALFANRLAALGFGNLASLAALEPRRWRARLPVTTPQENAFFATSSTLQLIFAFIHELAHCSDTSDDLLLRTSRDEVWEWWREAMNPYRDRIEGRLGSASPEWIEHVSEQAIGLLSEDERARFVTEVRAEAMEQASDPGLLANQPIIEVMDALLADRSAPLAEEVMCDAMAMMYLCGNIPVDGTTAADRIEASICAGRNLALLRHIEDRARVERGDRRAALERGGDALVRLRLLSLLGQSLLRGMAYLEFGESDVGRFALENALSAQDLFHARADLVRTATDLWLRVHFPEYLGGGIISDLGDGLPATVEMRTQLLRPAYRTGVSPGYGENGHRPSPLPADSSALDLAMGAVLRARFAPGVPASVTTDSLPESALRHRGYRRIRRSLRGRSSCRRVALDDVRISSLVATAVSAALWALEREPALRPFAICRPCGRSDVDFLHPRVGGSATDLIGLVRASIEARVPYDDLAVLVAGALEAEGAEEDTILVEIASAGQTARTTVSVGYQRLSMGRLRLVSFRIYDAGLGMLLRSGDD